MITINGIQKNSPSNDSYPEADSRYHWLTVICFDTLFSLTNITRQYDCPSPLIVHTKPSPVTWSTFFFIIFLFLFPWQICFCFNFLKLAASFHPPIYSSTGHLPRSRRLICSSKDRCPVIIISSGHRLVTISNWTTTQLISPCMSE